MILLYNYLLKLSSPLASLPQTSEFLGLLGILLRTLSEFRDHSLNSPLMPECKTDYISISSDSHPEDSKSE